MSTERALSLSEAAQLLGWSRRTLTRALERHGIATIGTGRRARLERKDLTWLQKKMLEDHAVLGLIYVIQALPETPIKVGFCNPAGLQQRVTALQTGNPHPLRVLGHVQAHPLDELKAHSALAQDRLTGEWFAWTPRTATFSQNISLGIEQAIASIGTI